MPRQNGNLTRSKRTSRRAAEVHLSPRELDIASWLGEDDTYAQIATHVGLKHDTVRSHARSVLRKLGVKTRHAAVARLIFQGFKTTQKGGIDRDASVKPSSVAFSAANVSLESK